MTVKRNLRAKYAKTSWSTPTTESSLFCPLCQRPMIKGTGTDQHHLIPKSQGGKESYLMHKICHRMIHATFSEKQLAKDYACWTTLQQAPQLASFLQWIAQKPATFSAPIRKPNIR